MFQGTAAHGWKGGWGTVYFLLRDRKGILTGPTVILGYFVLVNFILIKLYLDYQGKGALFDLGLLSRELRHRSVAAQSCSSSSGALRTGWSSPP